MERKLFERVLQKVLIVKTYSLLEETIEQLEQTRQIEIDESKGRGEVFDRVDRISQRSISTELKGENNPNWLNNILTHYSDMQISNYLRLVANLQSKHEGVGIDFSLDNFIEDETLYLSELTNNFIRDFSENVSSLDIFLSDYEEDTLNELFSILIKLVEKASLTAEEEDICWKIIESLEEEQNNEFEQQGE
ncbi:hypothetical protein SAMN04488134_103291 [Amphibacillus marinus]|uniref:Uncharacterized protein n=1 Tax=Amphibacillus marinus TaxID=872970 RepID=A0A1H8LRD9_9BACI|nr:hypothetical protein [Amphibacillus marinus]SEO07406.1 hypothetical protein SAMN04488134_103291 [Amphibacillus marinus]